MGVACESERPKLMAALSISTAANPHGATFDFLRVAASDSQSLHMFAARTRCRRQSALAPALQHSRPRYVPASLFFFLFFTDYLSL